MSKSILLVVTLQTEIQVPDNYDPTDDMHPFDFAYEDETLKNYDNWECIDNTFFVEGVSHKGKYCPENYRPSARPSFRTKKGIQP